ncbi:MAG: hypothetical protein E5X80_19010 [Mesorhizobium sp.]|uniref:hypothetical protein n=1 Tax=Mesorhizobium sp. TaxID=1871066 RepID=UPI000FE7B57B|nr:hypothetical protein [Mesorhizobium sp.]RWM04430.1 MAG: hypothetical protein EOR71_26225 [Mesorhizobium sp.]TIO50280.1 MAG: hypothetical protein E5X78_22000 [Mesorhizobium sp.]TIO58975.1 MAG: hypothetical protein E5X79_18675 [Mesorhizobium sp.]TJV61952.1 MAG: hypothetical protein E5X80_19010 [Mesorhizobium sp.]
MNIEFAILGIFTASMLASSAFAGALDNPATTPSFTTGSIKAMTGSKAMTNSGWTSSRECTHAIDVQHNDRCATTKQLGGAN